MMQQRKIIPDMLVGKKFQMGRGGQLYTIERLLYHLPNGEPVFDIAVDGEPHTLCYRMRRMVADRMIPGKELL